jgi:hypothetical protein
MTGTFVDGAVNMTAGRGGCGVDRIRLKFDLDDIFDSICAKIIHRTTGKCTIDVIYASALSVFEFSLVSR